MNQFYSVVLFNLYYLFTPNIMIAIYLVIDSNTHIFLRMTMIGYAVLILTTVLSINLLSSRISHSSRKPMKYLFGYLIGNHLRINCRLKTMSFIERLSGPDIGFYCLDLFPMNSFEFYLYVVNSVKLYILISDLEQ